MSVWLMIVNARLVRGSDRPACVVMLRQLMMTL